MRDFLVANAKIMGITISEREQESLLKYAQLIEKWNKTYNLTAISGLENIITHHILDSLSVLPLLPTPVAIADIGTGAGLPAVVIAIMTNNTVYAVDKVGKKTQFVQFVKAQLGLDNLSVLHKRVEEVELQCDIVTARAFASVQTIMQSCAHLLHKEGKFLLMKGVNYQQEQITGALIAHQVSIPQLSEERYILEIDYETD